jgi:PAS domain S-box-containing protein
LLRNITEAVRLEDQLNHRLLFIERLLESTVDRIVVLDRQMNCLYWNKKAEEHYGLLKTEVLGKNIIQVSSTLKNVPSMHEFRKALKGEKIYIPGGKNNDDTKYEETYIIPITDQKEVTSVLWIVHNLSVVSYTHSIS